MTGFISRINYTIVVSCCVVVHSLIIRGLYLSSRVCAVEESLETSVKDFLLRHCMFLVNGYQRRVIRGVEYKKIDR